MGISMRQHLASLVAVFLALLIGVLVGVSLSQEPRLERLMETLLQRNSELEQQQRKLTELNDLHSKFEASFAPRLVQERLVDRNVALFMTCVPEDDDLRDGIIAFLKEAGALGAVTVTFTRDYASVCERQGEALLQEFGVSADEGQGLPKLIAAQAAGAVSQGNEERLALLDKRGLVQVDGKLPGPLRLAVVAGGADTATNRRTDTVDEPLIRALLEAQVTTVGCERSETPESYMLAYQKANISTVDHVDKAAGLVSLVMALSGQPGHYGIKPSAGLPFPLLPPGAEPPGGGPPHGESPGGEPAPGSAHGAPPR